MRRQLGNLYPKLASQSYNFLSDFLNPIGHRSLADFNRLLYLVALIDLNQPIGDSSLGDNCASC
jgi:hypothetical protein